jgi:hypothetical protein
MTSANGNGSSIRLRTSHRLKGTICSICTATVMRSRRDCVTGLFADEDDPEILSGEGVWERALLPGLALCRGCRIPLRQNVTWPCSWPPMKKSNASDRETPSERRAYHRTAWQQSAVLRRRSLSRLSEVAPPLAPRFESTSEGDAAAVDVAADRPDGGAASSMSDPAGMRDLASTDGAAASSGSEARRAGTASSRASAPSTATASSRALAPSAGGGVDAKKSWCAATATASGVASLAGGP